LFVILFALSNLFNQLFRDPDGEEAAKKEDEEKQN